MKTLLVRSLTGLFLLALLASNVRAGAVAATGATLRITVKSAYLRAQPLPGAAPTYSVFRGQAYAVIGRIESSDWLLLAVNAAGHAAWIRAAFGSLSGSLAEVPVASPDLANSPTSLVTAADVRTTRQPNAVPIAVEYAVSVKSFFALNMPDVSGDHVASLFKGQKYPVQGRTADGQWLLLGTGAADGMWVETAYGSVTGDVSGLPVIGSASPAGATSGSSAAVDTSLQQIPPWLPAITSEMRQFYLDSVHYGRELQLFTVAGDCNSEPAAYLRRSFDYLNSGYGWLEPTRNYFAASFTHDTMAAHGGFGTNGVLDPSFAPTFCSGQGVYACELERSKASVVFIMLGTTEDASWHKFADNYRYMVWLALNQHVLPVLVTKADSGESKWSDAPPQYMNNVVRQLALEYKVPLLDFWSAAQTLPAGGLRDDIHLNDAGADVHLIATLETMYMLKGQ